ncbi:T-cell surface glycoprotein CD1b-2-like isoform X2 [Saccopteryx bilineata]|uniref:T-cell surface glycoprotein CD1b-2-like isoform X2 n=1 Tax=Saccopteryx bilineata TaxID=59482 RepID=UPI00338E52BA
MEPEALVQANNSDILFFRLYLFFFSECFLVFIIFPPFSSAFLFISLSLFSYPFTTALHGPTSFHLIQISSFVNNTWAQNQGSGWLEDLQIHGWHSDSGTAIFLKPWSKGNFSDVEITQLVETFRVYFIGLTGEIQTHVNDFQITYPFEIQGRAGCDLHSGETIVGFYKLAFGGVDLLKVQNYSWMPATEGDSLAQKFCDHFSKFQGFTNDIEELLSNTCPRFLLGVLDAGKAELQRQVKPEAWLSSDPPPLPGHLLLVCHVSGFYPKPVRVMWMRGEQEHPGTRQGDILPNADGTWYLRVTLDVVAGEEANLNCRVKHSSLGGQDIILHWGHPTSTVVIILAVILPIFILLICLALWYLRHRSCQNIQ